MVENINAYIVLVQRHYFLDTAVDERIILKLILQNMLCWHELNRFDSEQWSLEDFHEHRDGPLSFVMEFLGQLDKVKLF
jgi:hypothetical protein